MVNKTNMSNYIPIFQYAKNNGTSVQNVYRWIREGKITDIKKESVTVERIRIAENATPVIR